jgi:hypothetical protein
MSRTYRHSFVELCRAALDIAYEVTLPEMKATAGARA